MEESFRRELGSLESIFAFLQRFAARHGLDESVCYTLNLVVEELFTNMVKYSPDGHPRIVIMINREDERLVIRLRDRDVERFDITRVDTGVVEQPPELRRPGGLGLHLIREMVDEIHYQYENRESRITIVKNLEERHV